MVNFNKLKGLIREYEEMDQNQQQGFFSRLYNIAKEEMNLKQTGLGEWF